MKTWNWDTCKGTCEEYLLQIHQQSVLLKIADQNYHRTVIKIKNQSLNKFFKYYKFESINSVSALKTTKIILDFWFNVKTQNYISDYYLKLFY